MLAALEEKQAELITPKDVKGYSHFSIHF